MQQAWQAERKKKGGENVNKITRMTPKGAALIMADHYDSQDEAKDDRKKRLLKALEKLYQYESLDLEPEEIYDLLQLTATIRSKLNSIVTWQSPHKDKNYISKLVAVKISRDIKTGKIRVSAELQHDKQSVVTADINHIKELKDISLE